MARLEDLLKGIADAELRGQVEAEVAALKGRTRFGLVFERHLPETALTPDTDGLRVGDQVRLRENASNDLYFRVVSLENGRAQIASEENGEEVAVALKDLLVVKRFGDPVHLSLTPVGSVHRGEDRPCHSVINGENFHALQLLTFVHEGQVDCIYIDPPYNTGARDWTYNNRYVDSTDTYRHSKWLSFMEKRLRLAKRLLRPDGVLIVTIDENEVNHLGLLLEDIFPEYLRYQITIVINPKGVHKANFARMDEYAIYCVPVGDDLIQGEAVALTDRAGASGSEEWEWGLVRRRGSESRRRDRPSMFYPIYINEELRTIERVGLAIPLTEEPDFTCVDDLRPIWPIDRKGEHRRWQLGAESMASELAAGNLALGRHDKKRDSWTINVRRPKKKRKTLKTVWWETRHDAGTHGSNVVDAFLGGIRRFPFPKSIYAVRDCLAAVCRDRADALIVDFFAGSGTTLHATCLLNEEDGGRRRCILVTNNEVDPETSKRLERQGFFRGSPEYESNGIFEAVTRPRCSAAITGIRSDGERVAGAYLNGRSYSDGFSENVEFFRLDYIDGDRVELGKAFHEIHPLLWLAAGGRGERPEIEGSEDFVLVPGSGYGVLFKEELFRDFEEALAGHEEITHISLVTDSEEAYAEMRERVGMGRQSVMLYRDYLRHFGRQARL